MTVEQAVFAIAAVACMVGALITVTHRDPRTAGAALMVTLVGLAVLYAALAAPTVAAVVILVALFATVPLVVYMSVPAARAHTVDGPAVAGAAVIIGTAVLAILIAAIEFGEVPVNVSLRSSDGYDLAALRELLGGRSAAAAAGSVLLVAASLAAVHAARRDRRRPR